MINKDFVYDNVLPLIQEKGRMIDYYLVKSLFENQDEFILEELQNYQNKDGGFGRSLEPDSLCESSSIVSTDIAIEVLERVRNVELKEDYIKNIVEYLEAQYDPIKDGFHLTTSDFKNYPCAVWWNYDETKIDNSFGNPDFEVIGYLFKHRKYLKELDINKLINKAIAHINSKDFLDYQMHDLMSLLKFNKLMDKDIQNLIHDRIHLLVDKLLSNDEDKWNEYVLEPYIIYNIDPHFISGHNELLKRNLELLLQDVSELIVMPKWQWYQYDDIFEGTVKYMWMGYLYFQYIKALRLHREL